MSNKLSFERSAMNGEPMPPNLNGVEQCEFLGLTYLYKLYKSGTISREDAAKEKRIMLASFDRYEKMLKFSQKGIEYTINLWSTIGRYNKEYNDNRTLKNADALSKAIHGVLRTIPTMVEVRDGYHYCPCCGRLFEPVHADRKPRYCEDCGVSLRWE